jgi:DNA-directed RNA polymerase subunit RPC12/RpoP
MRIICFLREAGISINGIGDLFREENPEKVISVLLQEQEREIRKEIEDGEKKLEIIAEIRSAVKGSENFTVESIGDIANGMRNKEKLTKMRWMMILAGIPSCVLQWAAIILGITSGMWWMLGGWACVAAPVGIWITRYYFRHAAYICPECHNIFKCSLKKSFFSDHTPNTRRLTCPHCGKKSFCVETYNEGVEVSA